MKTCIVSGGKIDPDFALSFYQANAFDRIIGVDNGLKFLFEHGILPTHIVGDFDTAKPELVDFYRSRPEIEIRRFNPVKDSTDTQIAIELALEGQHYVHDALAAIGVGMELGVSVAQIQRSLAAFQNMEGRQEI